MTDTQANTETPATPVAPEVLPATQELTPMQEAIASFNVGDEPAPEGVVEKPIDTAAEGTPAEGVVDPAATPEPEVVADPAAEAAKPTSEAWATITRRERQLRQRETALKTQEAEGTTLQAKLDEATKFIELLKSDPYGNLDKIGVDYESWTTKILNGDSTPPPAGSNDLAELKAQVTALQEEIATSQTRTEESIQKRAVQQKALSGYRDEIMAKATESYPLVAKTPKGVEEAIKYASLYYDSTEQILSPDDACKAINEEIQKQYDTLHAIVTPKAVETTPAVPATIQPPPSQAGPKTISNQMTAATVPSDDDDTQESRMQAALKTWNAAS